MTIEIQHTHDLDIAVYARLFLTSKVSTPFHGLDFLWVLDKSRNDLKLRFLVVRNSGQTIAIMPYFSRRFFSRKKQSLIYGCYGGFIYDDKDAALMAEFVKHNIKRHKPVIHAYHDGNVYSPSPLKPTRHTTWIIDTDMSYEDLFMNLHYKTRNQVRKSMNSGTVVKDMNTEDELIQAKDIYNQLIDKHSISKPFKAVLFDELFEASKKGGNIFFKTAKLEDKVIAFSIFVYNSTEIFYWINASHKDYLSYNGTNSILNSMLMHCTQNKDIKWLNMGAVPEGNNTLLHFKKRWGAQKKVYFQYS